MGEVSMVERVARTLHESMSQQDIMGYLDAKIDADVLARAAIEAMREPTREMTADLSFSGMMEAEETYRAMIAAALKAESTNA